VYPQRPPELSVGYVNLSRVAANIFLFTLVIDEDEYDGKEDEVDGEDDGTEKICSSSLGHRQLLNTGDFDLFWIYIAHLSIFYI